MSKEIIAKLNDEDLEAVCGGGWSQAKFDEAFSAEAGKQTFLFIAAPIVIGVSAAVGALAHWGMGKFTKKLDEKIDSAKKPVGVQNLQQK